MHACEMTLAYLRGGLSTCSVVWVEFEYFSLKFINIVMQLCKISFRTLRTTAHTFFFKSRSRLHNLVFEVASFALVCDFELCVKMKISRVILSIFSDLTC